ncbi:hypothetical protein BACCIP111895_04274 [Neobacillus rhizosphaerae]|uniref:Uncharacterized protein n=1 Tax=Neobacillus rhizosphaerae TaxID=2880965 RepID=A0ABM9EWR5_9BACI|nr:hypothetical protein BACCIP111895_04274 [Neobacillus rhizosphaerae]
MRANMQEIGVLCENFIWTANGGMRVCGGFFVRSFFITEQKEGN